MKYIFMILIMFFLDGCSFAQKTEELGKGMTNVNNPIVFGAGLLLYKTGQALKDKEEEKEKEDE